ncbi:Hypothetical protein, putative [Bodo saltans]|uniref:Uncharacterized protein n=1 Tax=Bodo saltans TaxID=75058 RepID=A0A0S4JRF2_BODSA|nr:Hypothetical protein, putative [Bodo saltans]|eukprot:CUG91100.1 Hypothetical protein, putative [Bodo saltans]
MDGGAQTPSTRSSSTSTPQAASPRGTRDVSSPVSIAGGKESEELPNNQSGSSGGMLHQLAADLQQYEAKTSRFFRSLLPGGRTNEKIVRERIMTPKGSDEDDEDGDDALHTEQEHDDHSDDSELYSDDSQNLHGFESTIEGDQVVVNSEDDGEAASSASSSGVFRAYTDRRMAMILNSKAVTASFGGATTDGVIPSSDGEGIAVHAQQQQRVRSRSIDSKHLSAKGGSGAKGHRRSQSIGSVGGSIVAREQQEQQKKNQLLGSP